MNGRKGIHDSLVVTCHTIYNSHCYLLSSQETICSPHRTSISSSSLLSASLSALTLFCQKQIAPPHQRRHRWKKGCYCESEIEAWWHVHLSRLPFSAAFRPRSSISRRDSSNRCCSDIFSFWKSTVEFQTWSLLKTFRAPGIGSSSHLLHLQSPWSCGHRGCQSSRWSVSIPCDFFETFEGCFGWKRCGKPGWLCRGKTLLTQLIYLCDFEVVVCP